MHIKISLDDGVPIYRQIVNQVKYMVASGRLAPGEQLPAIRVLAQQLQVTPNTIVKAYDELAAKGLVHKRRGSGAFVSDGQSPLARRERRRIIESRADALMAEARQLGYSFDDVVDVLRKRTSVLAREGMEGSNDDRECG